LVAAAFGGAAAAAGPSLFGGTPVANAADAGEMTPSSSSSQLYTKIDQSKGYGYVFRPPSDCKLGNKPLRTHLDEINFFGETATRGYQYGVTVDPLVIGSLREFGTPEEVAAKVVLAEVNRDGVYDVKLMQDPVEGRYDAAGAVSGDADKKSYNGDYYELNYRSNGKRGTKRFVTKFMIENRKLYALTAQCKEDDYAALESDIRQAVDSFCVVPV